MASGHQRSAGDLGAVRRVPMLASRLMLVAALSALAVVMPASAALAHGGEEGTARELVLTAIAIIQTQPGERAAVEDKIHDATDSKETAGVDLGVVRRADSAFESGNLRRTQVLLQQSVRACPGPPILNIASAPRFPGGAALCPASTSLTDLASSRIGGTEGALLALGAVALIASGAVLAVRIR